MDKPYDWITNIILDEYKKHYGRTQDLDAWAKYAGSKIYQTFEKAEIKKMEVSFNITTSININH